MISCALRKSPVKICAAGELVELQMDESVLFSENGAIITFTGAGTATFDNDDVVTDAEFTINNLGVEKRIVVELTNGRAAGVTANGCLVELDYADGYSAVCGIRLYNN